MTLLIGLLLVVPVIMTEVSEESNYFDHHKLGNYLVLDVLPEAEQDDLVDVIISGEFEGIENSILQLESLYGNLNIGKKYRTLNGFKAFVTRNQIESLVLEKDVKSIISSNAPLETQIDDAISESNIDDLYSSPYSLDGSGITVAIIDSGCDVDHESFDDDQIVAFVDVTTGEVFTPPITGYDNGPTGHGTSMASIVAGTGAHEGVAPGAELVIICMWNSTGVGSAESFLNACDWIAVHKDDYGTDGIDIVSISLSDVRNPRSAHSADPYASAVDSLVEDEGLICITTAGSFSTSPRPIRTPGTAQYSITVGNVQDPQEGGWAKYYESREGPSDYSDTTPEGYYKPDIMAPGHNILCAEAGGDHNNYDEVGGTSPSTAFVAGVVALLLQADPTLADDSDYDGNPDVKQLLWASAVDVPGDIEHGFDNSYGCGRVDGLEIMDFLDTDISTTRQTAPTVFSGYPLGSYARYDEPLWRIDPVSKEDWYKVVVYGGHIITVEVMCDPDLMVEVRLYDNYLKVREDESIGRGDDCAVAYSAGSTKTYYIRIKLVGINGVQGWPGDWYDIHIGLDS